MIGVEETIWSEAFNYVLRRYLGTPASATAFRAGVVAACWHVEVFRGRDPLLPPSLEEAMVMYNELRGTVESEKLRIQKDLLGAVIERLEGRIKQLRESLQGDFPKFQNEEKISELRQLVSEFRKTLGT